MTMMISEAPAAETYDAKRDADQVQRANLNPWTGSRSTPGTPNAVRC